MNPTKRLTSCELSHRRRAHATPPAATAAQQDLRVLVDLGVTPMSELSAVTLRIAHVGDPRTGNYGVEETRFVLARALARSLRDELDRVLAE